ncbi:hypothetical protein LWI28_021272 [Acer negundo]|uniref:Transmembrane protein n=1 Tax=Acer negundo TaxID=4023 RepID=A0AAD5P7M1_ACENE|nr:hypothetical protein LWI28_021272 [Acer negundo]
MHDEVDEDDDDPVWWQTMCDVGVEACFVGGREIMKAQSRKKRGRGLCSREKIGLGVDSMSEKEKREENGFDLATDGGLIRLAFGVGLIWSLVVVYVGLTVMLAYVGLCGFDFCVAFSNFG